jgi:hypothetical protein
MRTKTTQAGRLRGGCGRFGGERGESRKREESGRRGRDEQGRLRGLQAGPTWGGGGWATAQRAHAQGERGGGGVGAAGGGAPTPGPARGGAGGGGAPPPRPRGGGAHGWAERGEREGFSFFLFSFYFPIIHFSFLVLTSTLRILFTNHSITRNKIMVRHDATTKENISRVCLHKVSS